MDDFWIGIYWINRKQSEDECARLIVATFRLLEAISTSLSGWYLTRHPKKGEVITSIEITENRIKNLIQDGQIYNDDNELMEGVGFNLFLKSDKAFEKANIPFCLTTADLKDVKQFKSCITICSSISFTFVM